MANDGKPDTNGSQFMVTLGACPEFDGKNLVFGWLTKGMRILDKLEASAAEGGGVGLKRKITIRDCGEVGKEGGGAAAMVEEKRARRTE